MDVCTKADVHFLTADLQCLITHSKNAPKNIKLKLST